MDTMQSIIVTSGFLLAAGITVFNRRRNPWVMFIGGFFLGLAANSLIELATHWMNG